MCFNPHVVKPSLLLALFLASQSLAEDARVTALVQQGDTEDARHQSRAALVSFHQAEAIEPENFGVLLRISKQYGDLVDQTKNKDGAKAFAEKALAYGRRAITCDSNSAKAHLNLSICYGKMTDFVGNKVKVEYAKLIHDEAQRSIELDATDDYAWHVMGRWHFGVANLNGVLRTLAGLVYGGLPSASNDEAAYCLKKAAELAPQRMMHHAELAKVYSAMGKVDLAAQEWQNVLGIRSADQQDESYQKEARSVLEARRPARGNGPRGVARR
jgi:tetratricopeptide (TPR) repeat protein